MLAEISVVIPVFNGGRFLRGCIQAVLNQSFCNFELLLIDDGSTDDSGGICDEYALTDKRVIVFHQDNYGVSNARNLGIAQAKGKWIVFVDADDEVSTDYLLHLYKGVSNNKSDKLLVFGRYNACGINVKKIPTVTLLKAEAAKYIMGHGLLALSAPYAKLYSRKLIIEKKVQFPVGIHMGEDGIFLQQYLNEVEAVSFISEVDYNVHNTEGSLSKRYYSFESEWNCFLLWKKYISEYVNNFQFCFPNSQQTIWNNRIGSTFLHCMFCVANQTPHWSITDQWKMLKKIPRREYEEFSTFYNIKSSKKRIYKFLIGHRWLLIFVLVVNCKNCLKI